MRRSCDYRIGLACVGLVAAILMSARTVHADFEFGALANLQETIPVIDAAHDTIVCCSSDGLEMYINTFGDIKSDDWDLCVLRRASIDDDWGPPENLGSPVNSPSNEAAASISTDGLTLYINSTRPGGYGGSDIWVTTRPTREDPWGPPVNPGPPINTSHGEGVPLISPDGLELYFGSNRPGGYGSWDFWVAKRPTADDPWGEPVNLGPPINSTSLETNPSFSPDGLLLLFSDTSLSTTVRPGGYGGGDMWMARRAGLSAPWGAPVNMGSQVNTANGEFVPHISWDGAVLYFLTLDSAGAWEYWQAPIVPIVDFSGDETVDAGDIEIMLEFWGTDEPLCDIGPFPWGDGVVDVEDLIVLVEHIVAARVASVEPEAVSVNEADDGGQVELVVGQMLVVTLESNPTTGYAWEQVEDQESILEQIGEAEFKPSETGEPPLVGAGGSEVFHFKATDAGQMTLQLVYHRSWEEGVEPLRIFSIEVVVR